jgi:hypothetical protein
MTPDLPAQPEPVEILLYQTEDGQSRLEVRLQEETVWLTQKRMAGAGAGISCPEIPDNCR